MSELSRFGRRALIVDEAHKFERQISSVLIEQLAGIVFIRHTYSWGTLSEIKPTSEINLVVYTPRQKLATKEIGSRLDEIAARFPAAQIIFMTETKTGIKHASISAELIKADVPKLTAKIKELLGIA